MSLHDLKYSNLLCTYIYTYIVYIYIYIYFFWANQKNREKNASDSPKCLFCIAWRSHKPPAHQKPWIKSWQIGRKRSACHGELQQPSTCSPNFLGRTHSSIPIVQYPPYLQLFSQNAETCGEYPKGDLLSWLVWVLIGEMCLDPSDTLFRWNHRCFGNQNPRPPVLLEIRHFCHLGEMWSDWKLLAHMSKKRIIPSTIFRQGSWMEGFDSHDTLKRGRFWWVFLRKIYRLSQVM